MDDATRVSVLSLRAAGWVLTRIADATGTTFAAVQRVCACPSPPHLVARVAEATRGLAPDPWPPTRKRADPARVLALLAEKTPKTDIARRLRCSVHTIRKIERAARGSA